MDKCVKGVSHGWAVKVEVVIGVRLFESILTRSLRCSVPAIDTLKLSASSSKLTRPDVMTGPEMRPISRLCLK